MEDAGRPGRVDAATRRVLRAGFADAWASRDMYMRYAAIDFIFATRPPKGQLVLAKALRSKHPGIIGTAQGTAMFYVSDGKKLQQPLIDALQHQAERGALEVERWMALEVLGRAGQGTMQWLQRLLEKSPYAGVRVKAAQALMERGSAVGKDLLLDDLRAHPAHHGSAHDVWAHRETLGLNAAERREVRKIVARYFGSLRRWLHDPATEQNKRRMAAGVLRELAVDGFTLTPQDLKAIRRVERRAARAKKR
jgi:hypothetical protein